MFSEPSSHKDTRLLIFRTYHFQTVTLAIARYVVVDKMLGIPSNSRCCNRSLLNGGPVI